MIALGWLRFFGRDIRLRGEGNKPFCNSASRRSV
jgi:hypothetical protein